MRLPVVEMAALLKRLWLEICRVCSTFSHLRTRRTHVDPEMVIAGNFAPYKAVKHSATPLWPGSGPQSTYETFHAFAPLNMPSADATDESFQAVISPLNTDAPLNMLLTEVTLPTSHCDRPLPSNFTARRNILVISVTDETSQLERSPLNWDLVSVANIPFIFVTLLVFQRERSPPEKARAFKNMFSMSVTDDTSHLDRSPSNVRAPPNMIFMLVTREVSHLLISWLNDCAFWNNEVMSVTNSVFQSGMSEHPALAQRGGAKGWSSGLAQWRSVEQHFSPEGTAARHASTAALSAVLVVNAGAHVALESTRSVHEVTPLM